MEIPGHCNHSIQKTSIHCDIIACHSRSKEVNLIIWHLMLYSVSTVKSVRFEEGRDDWKKRKSQSHDYMLTSLLNRYR